MRDAAIIMRKVAIALGLLASSLTLFISISFLNDAEKAPINIPINIPPGSVLPRGELRGLGYSLLICAIIGIVGCLLRLKDWGKLSGTLLIIVAIVSWYLGIIDLKKGDYRNQIVYLYTLLFIFSSLLSFIAPPLESDSVNITNIIKSQEND